MSDEANKEKSGAKKAETPQKVLIKLDMKDEVVLQFNMDDKLELVWDEGSYRELPEAVENQLRPKNLKNYLIVQFKMKEKAENAIAFQRIENPLNPLGMNAERRLSIRARQGWHQAWKSPGQDLDEALAGPYKQVRKLKGTGKKDKNGEEIMEEVEPGYENGEVLKLIDENGKVELVAVECPQDKYEGYLEWMAQSSIAKYASNKTRFAGNIEELNRREKKEHRLHVFDGDERVL